MMTPLHTRLDDQKQDIPAIVKLIEHIIKNNRTLNSERIMMYSVRQFLEDKFPRIEALETYFSDPDFKSIDASKSEHKTHFISSKIAGDYLNYMPRNYVIPIEGSFHKTIEAANLYHAWTYKGVEAKKKVT